MLKITKDVTIRHDGKEVYCKAGQIVDVRRSFDITDERARGIEIRYADKFRNAIKLVTVTDNVKVDSLNPGPVHNQVEQKKRKEVEAILETEEITEVQPEETKEETEKKRGRPRK